MYPNVSKPYLSPRCLPAPILNSKRYDETCQYPEGPGRFFVLLRNNKIDIIFEGDTR